MKRIAIILTLATGCHLTAGAQASFTERIQQRGSQAEGKLTISHSQAIDQLVNRGSQPAQTNQATNATTATTATATTANKAPARKPDSVRQATIAPTLPQQRRAESERSDSSQKPTRDDEPKRTTTAEPTTDREESEATTVDTRKKVMRRSYRVTGYRVQAYAGGNQRKDRQRAEQIGNTIKQNYPEEPIYVHFYSPRWICRVGNYRTYEEAHQMLLNIRRLGYTSATIVKGKISIQY